MTYFFVITLPFLIGGSLIMLGLRLSPLLVALGITLWATTWLLG